jgi:uncharacterized RDD family membrane protein YckC
MTTAHEPEPPQPRPDAAQRSLELAMRVGVALGVVGLVTTAVIVALYIVGAQTPGTWAYGLAMLAPLGFALILLAIVGVALRRRRVTIDERGSGTSEPTS